MKAPLIISIILSVLVALVPGPARAGTHGMPTAAIQWVLADVMESGAQDWKLGMGFNLSGGLPVSAVFDLRADWGSRWLEGESRLVTDPDDGPRWGGRAGEITEGLRVMPATLDLVYRFEGRSERRFWVPYLAAGPGTYDLRATFTDAGGSERDHALSRLGWHLRGGVRLHRTSGLNVSLETTVHFIDTPGEMSPMWEAALGLGTQLPGRSR